jgi:predicted helicase
MPWIFPNEITGRENRIICLTDRGSEKPFMTIISNVKTDLHVVGAGSGAQCFPFYTYNEDGSNRRENITDWALGQFRAHYSATNISKWDIFHYVYAVLHHPEYRQNYEANLKRELPRIPFTLDFWGFVEAGKELARIHVHYEEQEDYPLEIIETPGLPLNWHVEKMRLSKDKTRIVYCKDADRRGDHEHTSFTFLGFTFRQRKARRKNGELFMSFLPAMSTEARVRQFIGQR